MVRTYNNLDIMYRYMPDGRDLTQEERFDIMRRMLRNKCQWDHLGMPSEWPEDMEEALLDREEELKGLGINSDTSDDEKGP